MQRWQRKLTDIDGKKSFWSFLTRHQQKFGANSMKFSYIWCVTALAGTPWANPNEFDLYIDNMWRIDETSQTLDVYHFKQKSRNKYKKYPMTTKVSLDKIPK